MFTYSQELPVSYVPWLHLQSGTVYLPVAHVVQVSAFPSQVKHFT